MSRGKRKLSMVDGDTHEKVTSAEVNEVFECSPEKAARAVRDGRPVPPSASRRRIGQHKINEYFSPSKPKMKASKRKLRQFDDDQSAAEMLGTPQSKRRKKTKVSSTRYQTKEFDLDFEGGGDGSVEMVHGKKSAFSAVVTQTTLTSPSLTVIKEHSLDYSLGTGFDTKAAMALSLPTTARTLDTASMVASKRKARVSVAESALFTNVTTPKLIHGSHVPRSAIPRPSVHSLTSPIEEGTGTGLAAGRRPLLPLADVSDSKSTMKARRSARLHAKHNDSDEETRPLRDRIANSRRSVKKSVSDVSTVDLGTSESSDETLKVATANGNDDDTESESETDTNEETEAKRFVIDLSQGGTLQTPKAEDCAADSSPVEADTAENSDKKRDEDSAEMTECVVDFDPVTEDFHFLEGGTQQMELRESSSDSSSPSADVPLQPSKTVTTEPVFVDIRSLSPQKKVSVSVATVVKSGVDKSDAHTSAKVSRGVVTAVSASSSSSSNDSSKSGTNHESGDTENGEDEESGSKRKFAKTHGETDAATAVNGAIDGSGDESEKPPPLEKLTPVPILRRKSARIANRKEVEKAKKLSIGIRSDKKIASKRKSAKRSRRSTESSTSDSADDSDTSTDRSKQSEAKEDETKSSSAIEKRTHSKSSTTKMSGRSRRRPNAVDKHNQDTMNRDGVSVIRMDDMLSGVPTVDLVAATSAETDSDKKKKTKTIARDYGSGRKGRKRKPSFAAVKPTVAEDKDTGTGVKQSSLAALPPAASTRSQRHRISRTFAHGRSAASSRRKGHTDGLSSFIGMASVSKVDTSTKKKGAAKTTTAEQRIKTDGELAKRLSMQLNPPMRRLRSDSGSDDSTDTRVPRRRRHHHSTTSSSGRSRRKRRPPLSKSDAVDGDAHGDGGDDDDDDATENEDSVVSSANFIDLAHDNSDGDIESNGEVETASTMSRRRHSKSKAAMAQSSGRRTGVTSVLSRIRERRALASTTRKRRRRKRSRKPSATVSEVLKSFEKKGSSGALRYADHLFVDDRNPMDQRRFDQLQDCFEGFRQRSTHSTVLKGVFAIGFGSFVDLWYCDSLLKMQGSDEDNTRPFVELFPGLMMDFNLSLPTAEDTTDDENISRVTISHSWIEEVQLSG